MASLPILIGGTLILGGIVWLVWPASKKKPLPAHSLHCQIEDLIALAKSEKVKQHLREAGKALYEVPSEEQ